MREFDYIIFGGGCAGLSLAYELEVNKKLQNKTLAIIETRTEYKRDKTWSFWRVVDHNFDDCVIKSWKNFTINTPSKTKYLKCEKYPYQTIDSGLFYKKILNKIKRNSNINFFTSTNDINLNKGKIFNSVPSITNDKENLLWQRFCGVEIETKKNIFDDSIFNLMDFDCEQRDSVHFFYTLPYSQNKALIETTWISELSNKNLEDYDNQIKKYINDQLKIKDYNIVYKEIGDIPLFHHTFIKKDNEIKIGGAGDMTRLSTGYTFLNIQEHSKYIVKNIDKDFNKINVFKINGKYQFLDNIFLKVLKKHPNKMPNIFYSMFESSPNTVINFLSNKSNLFQDLSIILKMPKWIFFKEMIGLN